MLFLSSAVARNGPPGNHDVYTWGMSAVGALGLGSDGKAMYTTPQKVVLPADVQPKQGGGHVFKLPRLASPHQYPPSALQ